MGRNLSDYLFKSSGVKRGTINLLGAIGFVLMLLFTSYLVDLLYEVHILVFFETFGGLYGVLLVYAYVRLGRDGVGFLFLTLFLILYWSLFAFSTSFLNVNTAVSFAQPSFLYGGFTLEGILVKVAYFLSVLFYLFAWFYANNLLTRLIKRAGKYMEEISGKTSDINAEIEKGLITAKISYDDESAKEILKKALKLEGGKLQQLRAAGDYLYKNNMYEESKAYFNRAKEVAGEKDTPHVNEMLKKLKEKLA